MEQRLHGPEREAPDLVADWRWVHRFARNLLADENNVDDVVQQTLIAADRSSPTDPAERRYWMKTVARNFARRVYRDRSRRYDREASVAKAEVTDPRTSDVEIQEWRTTVRKIVYDLREPYRSVVLQHFFDGLTPNEIASREGVPSNTIRVRLKRAKVVVLETLQQRCGNEPRAWRSGLVLLASLDLGRDAAPAAATLAATQSSSGASSTSATVGSATGGAMRKYYWAAVVVGPVLLWLISNSFFGGAGPAAGDECWEPDDRFSTWG